MTRVQLRLLGGFQITCDEKAPCSVGTDKERALLTYLVLESGGRPLRRESLCELFWDGYTFETARHSLRNALYNLRKLFAPLDLIQTTRQTVQLDASHPELWCDVLAFQELTRQAEHASPSLRQIRCQEALSLYRGEFLEGLRLRDCPKYGEWQARQQIQLAQQARQLMRSLENGPPGDRPTRKPGRLPRSLTPFFGRESELKALATKVIDPAYPLITITGEGGIGKTRLALALAEQVQDHFADGVWFVSFAGTRALHSSANVSQARTTDEVLTTSIGEALSLTASAAMKRGQLFQALRDRALLLVLDNFEEVDDGEGFVVDLLQACPQVGLVVTSRKRLNLQAETVFRLHGLPVPSDPVGAFGSDSAIPFGDPTSSLRLFAERADRATDGFALDAGNVHDVIRICRIVEGLPLAIELSAALVDRFSCAALADAIETGCDVLATTLRDVPPHHRSLRVVFDTSWNLLSDEEQRALARCTVFQGGFREAAGRTVAQTTAAVLQALVDRSLLRQNDSARFDLHEIVRQFSAEKLAWIEGEPATSQAAHCATYADFFAEREERLANEPVVTQEALEEYLNARAAWQWASRTSDLAALRKLVRGLSQVYYLRGALLEAADAFGQAADALRPGCATSTEAQRVYARVLIEQSFFAERLGRLDEAAAQAEEANQLGQLLTDDYVEAASYLRLAAIRWLQEDYPNTRLASERGLKIAERLGDTRLQTIGLSGLGNVLNQENDLGGAILCHEQALAVALFGGQRRLASVVATNLGNGTLAKGNLSRAKDLFAQALTIGRDMHNPQSIAIARRGLCRLALALGDPNQALIEGQQALQIFEEIGDAIPQQRIPLYLALAHFWRGEDDVALESCKHTLERTGEGPARQHKMQAFTLQGWIYAAQGQFDHALAACSQALTLGQPLPASVETTVARSSLALVALKRDDLPAALEQVESVLPTLDLLPYDPMSDPLIAYLACCRVLDHAGDDRAAEVLQSAWQRLQQIAATIQDGAGRHGFLHRVPAHRELGELVSRR